MDSLIREMGNQLSRTEIGNELRLERNTYYGKLDITVNRDYMENFNIYVGNFLLFEVEHRNIRVSPHNLHLFKIVLLHIFQELDRLNETQNFVVNLLERELVPIQYHNEYFDKKEKLGARTNGLTNYVDNSELDLLIASYMMLSDTNSYTDSNDSVVQNMESRTNDSSNCREDNSSNRSSDNSNDGD